ncbi:unnamed protein product [Bursaphelenchus okinawaensis]|uniref:Kelch domain-containing protein 10 n=1 Tax=Bursaphelenchus okinawaensis TaxID=465554 RepID=A0A811KE97_9BILA|nr:unnamed protein product [Bursaphelenchus okinawaensis]CAG9102859.1 unnamed protein product [Bursaphelenchus okinawaensis]
MVSAFSCFSQVWNRPKKRLPNADMYTLSKPELLVDNYSLQEGEIGKSPPARSGHRCFCTGDHFYVVGGYNPKFIGKMMNDVWCLNLLTKRWKKVKTDCELPKTLASFSLSYVEEQATFYLYGGTGFPFGEAISTNLYACTLISPEECTVRKIPIDNPREAPRVYGHSAVHRHIYNDIAELYLLGGTEGVQYDMRVTRLTVFKEHARFETLSDEKQEPMGRYRHESVMVGDEIISIGGSNQIVSVHMRDLDAFNVKTKTFHLVHTQPDAVWRYPRSRKGHSVVQAGNFAILFGGYNPPDVENSEGLLMKDVWCLDLRTLKWQKSPFELPSGVFFHSAAVNSLNQIISFGGCAELATKRVDDTVAFHIGPPPLSYMAAKVFLEACPEFRKINGMNYTNMVPRIAQQLRSQLV